jgi:hypothetical protein
MEVKVNKGFNWRYLAIILIILLALVGGGLGFYLANTSGKLSDTQNKLTAAQSQLSDTEAQLSTAQGQVSNLQTTVAKMSNCRQFSDVSELETWLTGVIANNKTQYTQYADIQNSDTDPEGLPMCNWLQQQATLSGYLLSTESIHLFSSTDFTEFWGWLLSPSVYTADQKTYLISCGTTEVTIYETDQGVAEYITPFFSGQIQVWTGSVSLMQPRNNPPY